jgi:hypothetical protein
VRSAIFTTFVDNGVSGSSAGADLQLLANNSAELPVLLWGVLFAGAVAGADSCSGTRFAIEPLDVTWLESFAPDVSCGRPASAAIGSLTLTTVPFLGSDSLPVPVGDWPGLDAVN